MARYEQVDMEVRNDPDCLHCQLWNAIWEYARTHGEVPADAPEGTPHGLDSKVITRHVTEVLAEVLAGEGPEGAMEGIQALVAAVNRCAKAYHDPQDETKTFGLNVGLRAGKVH